MDSWWCWCWSHLPGNCASWWQCVHLGGGSDTRQSSWSLTLVMTPALWSAQCAFLVATFKTTNLIGENAATVLVAFAQCVSLEQILNQVYLHNGRPQCPQRNISQCGLTWQSWPLERLTLRKSRTPSLTKTRPALEIFSEFPCTEFPFKKHIPLGLVYDNDMVSSHPAWHYSW